MKREASLDDAEGGPATRQARLSPSALDSDDSPCLEVRDSTRPLFRRLCKEFGWPPTGAIGAKISHLLGIDTSRSDLEPALFAFVQHLSFIWHADEGALFIGVKKVNDRHRLIWYKPSTSGASVGSSLWMDRPGSHDNNGMSSYTPRMNDVVDQVLVSRFWPSFTTAFGLTSDEGNYKYISGVHTILLTFPRLGKSCTNTELRRWAAGRLTALTDHVPLRKYELPFLPESVWMSKSIEPQRPRMYTPSGGSSSGAVIPSSSSTTRQSSVREIERIQNIIQTQRGQKHTGHGRLDKRKPRSPQPTVAESGERISEPLESSETASEAATEGLKSTSPKDDRQFELELNAPAVKRMHEIFDSACIKISAIELDAAANAQVQMTFTFPAQVFQQQSVLHFSPIASVDLPPIAPLRRLVLEALCALAMNTVDDDGQR
ncbi:hypothetical protein QM012_008484 [Aureobasidium pullulans]|uniref:DUF3074 domain-containing protein n=1 Tax=Aureobasidium pullulans TaxID=5580 RepID=A0ABR0TJM8_AURPU